MRICYFAFARRTRGPIPCDHGRWRGLSLLLIAVSVLSCGCVADAIRSTCRPYEAIKERSVVKWQAHRAAQGQWRDGYAVSYSANPCVNEIRDGFVAAYVDTAMGLGNCPPPIPTRPALSRYTITHDYPAAGPWYEGYNLGHVVAVSRGVDRWRLAPLNPDLIAACGQCPSLPYDQMIDPNDEKRIMPLDVEPIDRGLIEESSLPEELPPVIIESMTS